MVDFNEGICLSSGGIGFILILVGYYKGYKIWGSSFRWYLLLCPISSIVLVSIFIMPHLNIHPMLDSIGIVLTFLLVFIAGYFAALRRPISKLISSVLLGGLVVMLVIFRLVS